MTLELNSNIVLIKRISDSGHQYPLTSSVSSVNLLPVKSDDCIIMEVGINGSFGEF